jgi:hypothetical protein
MCEALSSQASTFRASSPIGQHCHRRNEICPAHRLQGGEDLGKGPLGHRVTDRLLQTLDTLALLARRPHKLFERNTLLAMKRGRA